MNNSAETLKVLVGGAKRLRPAHPQAARLLELAASVFKVLELIKAKRRQKRRGGR